MDIQIRKADINDVDAIVHITKNTFARYAKELGKPDKVAALHENKDTVIKDLSKKTILVATVNGEIKGTIRYERIPGNIAYISRFGVLQEEPKCGIGKMLIDTVVQECLRQNISAMALHTCTKMLDLVRYYYSLGFYIHSTTHDRGYVRGLFLRELTNQQYETLDLDYVSKL